LCPDHGIEVAVAVEVGEARHGEETDIDAVEGIGGAGALGEGRRGGGTGVLEIVQEAVEVADEGVEVAVAVEVGEARRAVVPHTAVERIGGAGALGEDRRGGRAGVLEIVQGAVVVADDGVEVAVAVEVGEAGRAAILKIDSVERIGGTGPLGEGRRDGGAGVLEIVVMAEVVPDDGVEIAVAVEVGEAGRAEVPNIDAVERVGGAGLLRKRERCDGGEAGGVGDLELEAAVRGRRVRGIGVGQVLDQRLDRRRRRRRIEGDGERAAGAAGEAADDGAAEADVAAGDADLARAAALVADRHRVLRQQVRDRQRAGVEVVVRVGEGDVRGDDLRRAVDRILQKRNRRGEAGERRNRVRHRLKSPFPAANPVATRQKPSCELRAPPRGARIDRHGEYGCSPLLFLLLGNHPGPSRPAKRRTHPAQRLVSTFEISR
jgi:hypothetical protein